LDHHNTPKSNQGLVLGVDPPIGLD
jgi:hypothetical protein